MSENKETSNEAFLVNEIGNSDFESVRNRTHAATLNELKEQISPHYSELSTMPYDEYVDKFLTVHLGLVKKDEQGRIVSEPDEFTLAHWISFAGGIHRGVNLVNDRGEYVITVPPLASFINDDLGDLKDLPQEEKLAVLREEETFSQNVEKLRDFTGYRQQIGNNLRIALFDKEAEVVGKRYTAVRDAWHDFFEKLGLFDKENYIRSVAELTGQEYVPSEKKKEENKSNIADDIDFVEVDNI